MRATALTPAKVHHRLALSDLVVSEFSQRPSRVPKHFHESAILSVVLEGVVREQIGNAQCELSLQTVVFKPAGEAHTHEYGSTGARVVAVELGAKVAAEWMEQHAERLEISKEIVGRAALSRLRCELRAPDDLSAMAIQSAVLELVTAMIRGARRSRTRASVASVVREYIHFTPPASLELTGLAAQLGISIRQLDTSFRREHGCSIAEYIRDHRFSRALELISTSEMPFAAIAHEAGYCDQAHMSRDCSQRTGIVPSLMRQRARKNTKPLFHPRQFPPRMGG